MNTPRFSKISPFNRSDEGSKSEPENMSGEVALPASSIPAPAKGLKKLLTAEIGGKKKATAIEGSFNEADDEPKKKSSMNVDIGEVLSKYKKIPTITLLIFYQQMATMLEAGIDVLSSLRALEEEENNMKFHEVLSAMVKDIGNGHQVWQAMEQHPRVFTRIYVSIIKSGESTGSLDGAFKESALQMEKSYDMEKEVKSALVYPKVILGITAVMVMGMVLIIIPKLLKAINGLITAARGGHHSQQLPIETQILVTAAHILTPPGKILSFEFWFFSPSLNPGTLPRILILFLLWYGLGHLRRAMLENERIRHKWDAFKLRCPMKIGPIYTKIIMARFARGFSSMLRAGTPIQEALVIVAETTSNTVIGEAITKARDSIMSGSSISQPLKDSGLFPNLITKAIQSGEKTGELETMMEKVAEHYEKDVEKQLKGLTKIIEPILIVVLGGIVLYVALSFYLAIYSSYMHLNGNN